MVKSSSGCKLVKLILQNLFQTDMIFGGYCITHYSFTFSVGSWLKLDVLVIRLLLISSEDHFFWDLSFL